MRTEQLKLNHMYEISNGTAPNYMTSMFEKNQIILMIPGIVCRCLLYQELISLA